MAFEQEDFYVNLTSTDSLGIFPENQANNFSNFLVRELAFEDISTYEVGLSEISYVSSFYNLDKKSNFSLFDFNFEWPDKKWGRIYDARLDAGYYPSAKDLCKVLNDKVRNMNIQRFKDYEIFQFDDFTKKFTLNVHEKLICLIFHGDLINILGLSTLHYTDDMFSFIGMPKSGPFYIYKGVKRFYYRPDITWKSDSPEGGECHYVCQMITISSFYVYADLIRERIYGSNYSQLLRQVPIRGQYGSRSVQTFQNPFYLPLHSANIRSINIKIFSISGVPLNFLEGNLSIVLHFRRKRRSY